MNSAGQRILKNASFLMLSQLVTWVLSLALTMILPRYLGPRAIGQLHIGYSVWFMLLLLVDLGMETLLIKEVARSPERTGKLVGTSLVLRTALLVGALGLLAVYLASAGYAPDTVLVVWLLAPNFILYQFNTMCGAVLHGLERMEVTSLATIAGKAIYVAATIACLALGANVQVIAFISAIGMLVNSAILWRQIVRLYRPDYAFDWSMAKWMIRASLPYFLSSAMLIVYANIDMVVISLLLDETTSGWYGVADQFLGTFVFIPVVITQAIFPAMTRSHQQDARALAPLLQRSLNWVLAMGVPLGVGLTVVARPIVVLVFGSDFAASGSVLAVLGLVLIGMYVNILIGKYLLAVDRQNTWTLVMSVAALATIPLDVILVPWSARVFGNGAMGGAFSYLVTEFGMVAAGLMLLPKGMLRWADWGMVARVIAAGALMGLIVSYWRNANVFVPVIIGAAAYIPIAFVFRVVNLDDLTRLAGLAAHAVQRLRTRLASRTT